MCLCGWHDTELLLYRNSINIQRTLCWLFKHLNKFADSDFLSPHYTNDPIHAVFHYRYLAYSVVLCQSNQLRGVQLPKKKKTPAIKNNVWNTFCYEVRIMQFITCHLLEVLRLEIKLSKSSKTNYQNSLVIHLKMWSPFLLWNTPCSWKICKS